MPSKLKEKLRKGEWISAMPDETLRDELNRACRLCQKLNQVERDSGEYEATLSELFGTVGENAIVRAPLFVDYGYNTHIGNNCFINYNCVILDEGKVEIGDRSWIGPGVHIYAVEHKISPKERDAIRGVPVIIEEDVWIGGHATILPGVRMGRGSLIGAGSVVTKDVEKMVVVAGNPARKIREL
jgi:maltose O-acetyltransferase